MASFFSGIKNFFTGSEDKKAARDVTRENMAMTRMEFEEQWRRGHLERDITESAGIARVGASGVTMAGSPERARAAAETEFDKEMDWMFQASEQRRRIEKKGGQRAESAATTAGISRTLGLVSSAPGTITGFMALSSRAMKEPVGHIDRDELITGLMSLEVARWKYKEGLNDTVEHIGPYAEDFQQAFNIGDGTHINLIDALGILIAVTQKQQKEIERLKQFVMVT